MFALVKNYNREINSNIRIFQKISQHLPTYYHKNWINPTLINSNSTNLTQLDKQKIQTFKAFYYYEREKQLDKYAQHYLTYNANPIEDEKSINLPFSMHIYKPLFNLSTKNNQMTKQRAILNYIYTKDLTWAYKYNLAYPPLENITRSRRFTLPNRSIRPDSETYETTSWVSAYFDEWWP